MNKLHISIRLIQLLNENKRIDSKLMIMGDKPLPVTTMRILRDAFDDSDRPFQVDLVEWVSTPVLRI